MMALIVKEKILLNFEKIINTATTTMGYSWGKKVLSQGEPIDLR